MDLDKTIETLKKDLEIFCLNHRCSKLELYRKYQQYIKKWKLDNFETMDEKLSASKKIFMPVLPPENAKKGQKHRI